MEELKLKKITLNALKVDVSDRESQIIRYYSSYTLAMSDAKGAGWYGSDGEVLSIEAWTDGEKYFLLNNINVPYDIRMNIEKEMNEKICSKLTDSEIDFLIKNPLKKKG